MTNFRPIPGVWYTDRQVADLGVPADELEAELLVAYLPNPYGSGDIDWYSPANGGFISDDDVKRGWPNLVEAFNPHPPITTELQWCVQEKNSKTCRWFPIMLTDEWENVMSCISNSDLETRVLERSIQTTDWQEIEK
jgi:hypothetical protein